MQTKLIMMTERDLQELIECGVKDALIEIIDWLRECKPEDTLTARNLIMNHAVLPIERRYANVH